MSLLTTRNTYVYKNIRLYFHFRRWYLCGAEKQSKRIREHGGAVGRRKSQWTTDFSRNSGTYIVYNSHVTCSNSSFSLPMATSHSFVTHATSLSLFSIGYVVCFPLATCTSPVLWAYASVTITEFNHAQCSGDFPISLTGCICFQHPRIHNNRGHGDISAITLLILSLNGCSRVNILWYTAPEDMMTFRWSHRSYQSFCQQHPPYSYPQVTLIYYINCIWYWGGS